LNIICSISSIVASCSEENPIVSYPERRDEDQVIVAKYTYQ
jgi:hypothetical protein